MRDLFRANLRRDLIAAGMLLAFATIAMAAAQWGTFLPGEPATLTGEKDVAFMGDVDHRLPSASADAPRVPMFTTGGSPVADGALPADSVLPPLPEVAAASATTAGGLGTVAPAENWHAPAGFGSGERSPFLRGASSSSSGVGSIAGMGGGGAWGGVSGTGTTKETIVAGASSRIVAAAPAARSNGGSSNGSSGGSRPAASSGPAFSAHAAAPVAAAAFQHASGPPLGDPAPGVGAGNAHDTPSSAPTPEPLSFILVGVGLAGIYAVRKHLR
jgi:hypothetical protein